jgi:chromosome segregation ATPase
MKSYNGVAFLVALVCLPACAVGVQNGSPVTKVTQLLADLEAKIVREGEEAKKVFEEFMEWCEDTSKNVKYSIKTAKSQIENLQATISEETSAAQALTAKVEELGSSISTDDADLKAATDIRVKAAADFKVTEKDLTEVISALQRAIAILEREMRKKWSFRAIAWVSWSSAGSEYPSSSF